MTVSLVSEKSHLLGPPAPMNKWTCTCTFTRPTQCDEDLHGRADVAYEDQLSMRTPTDTHARSRLMLP